MDPNPIPDEVRRFILMNGLTVPDLEALLVLRERGAAGLPATGLASRLYISPDHARTLLAKLDKLELVALADEPGFRFSPRTDALRAIVEAVLSCYERHLVPVSQLIHSAERRSSETQSAQAFADAFRIRKET
ncbi:hypothetical protein [Tahibacter caeni]|uniref:hypothetical protein n=1 Tax=Tahibacter caeni TaxID=1453545 RepID=UPI002148B5C3|nr:hypothetical protein [Tahibacter caeni]